MNRLATFQYQITQFVVFKNTHLQKAIKELYQQDAKSTSKRIDQPVDEINVQLSNFCYLYLIHFISCEIRVLSLSHCTHADVVVSSTRCYLYLIHFISCEIESSLSLHTWHMLMLRCCVVGRTRCYIWPVPTLGLCCSPPCWINPKTSTFFGNNCIMSSWHC